MKLIYRGQSKERASRMGTLKQTFHYRRVLLALTLILASRVALDALAMLLPTDPLAREQVENLLAGAQPLTAFGLTLQAENMAGLSGSLFFIEQRAQPNYRLAQLNFATGQISTTLAIPAGGLVYQVGQSTDSQQLLLAYSAPPAANQPPYQQNGLYSLDVGTANLVRVLGDDVANVYYAYPQQRGDNFYYVVYERGQSSRRIEVYNRRDSQRQVLLENATRPTLSADGQWLAYLSLNPETGARALWALHMASGQSQRLVSEQAFPDLDHPLLAADSAWLYFAVPESAPVPSRQQPWWGGYRPTLAHGNHNLPMQWYRVAVGQSAASPTRLSHEATIALAGDLNGQQLGVATPTGFYVLRRGQLIPIIQSRALGAFAWLPAQSFTNHSSKGTFHHEQ
jgi:hypothetical protein